ncbi:MAG: hypothetical protein UV33_C0025G0011 [Candidatus Daviesbacteria bacterium GW2011_GWA1_42_6]|uniref:Uncharacterized protein n=2 Tax=Candidatus Daviesiibacteriota TaxID=1752718 RepID=A0A0G1AU38_9BACT|nr:MAG: hypothetical protein UV33_C0025G0011 [Candidatus Daviesbacteria bacterium GW2011_GWA1_42_6]
MKDFIILEIRTPRTGEETPEAMVQFLGSLANVKTPSSFFGKKESPLSLEIAVFDQAIHFYLTLPKTYQAFVESQLFSQYPRALVSPVDAEKFNGMFSNLDKLSVTQMKLTSNRFFPLRTYQDFKEVDPLSSPLGMLSKLGPEDVCLIQFLLIPIGQSWQSTGRKALEPKVKDSEGTSAPSAYSAYSKEITEKISHSGFKVGIRILCKSPNPTLASLITATFTAFNNPAGNSLGLTQPTFWQKKKLARVILNRDASYISGNEILNLLEIATLFHFPGLKLANIKNISWSKTILSDPPDNLPVALGLTDEEKSRINFMGRCEFKNRATVFGIRKVDRRKHVYIIGKTGTGKSTLIANMVINDIRNREGVAVIDPHGDLSEILLNYIPSYRVNDVAYLNPADVDHPFHLNPLEVSNPAEKELVASGIVAIFHKLYANSWGPRLEYILRNTILTLLEVPNATLLMVPEILANAKFRKKVVEELKDPVLKSFWLNEFEKMSESMRNEAISPILNKVGQFISSPTIRNIIGSPKSTVNLEEIMNKRKILILNLSQGRIGEDNSALLGAMIITKIQLAAMNRVSIAEEERADFYLYVDEFQNFATSTFIKILSEARKYRLNLILANQYIAQIMEEVRSAIFGNAGTMLSFIIGAEDTPFMAREFGERFTEKDLLSLGNYQVIIKMAIEGLTCSPFLAQSLPLPDNRNQNMGKILKVSQERYTKTSGESKKSQAIKAPKLNRKEMMMRIVHKYE